MSYTESLSKSGLTPAQAEVYEALLSHGIQTAGSLAKKTSLKRGLTYKVLDDLVALGLAGKEEEVGKVARFFPKHPSILRDIMENRRKSLKDAELSLDGVLPSLISNFNMVSGAPGVEIYEGLDGAEKVLNDSLSSRTPILTYADSEAIEKYAADINRRYVKKREKLGIQKKLILFDSPTARKRMESLDPSMSETKLLFSNKGSALLQSAMEIYDGKVAYLTFAPERMMGVIISDPFLYALHTYLFEHTWSTIPDVKIESKNGKPKIVGEKGDLTRIRDTTQDTVVPETKDGPEPFEEGKYDDDEYFVRL